MVPWFFNGKFYAGDLNGVHRVADRLIREVDAILSATELATRPRVTLLVPRRRRREPDLHAVSVVECQGAERQMWEQLSLPRLAHGGVLVNLCNLAPIAHRRKVLMVHDAQFLLPDSGYPLRQKLGYRVLVPRMARSSRQVLTVSDYSRQMLALLGVVPREKVAVIHNGADHIGEMAADHPIVPRLGLTAGGFVLLFGSGKPYKNTAVLLEAFAGGAMQPLRLVIVGVSRDELMRAGMPPPADAVFASGINDAGLRALYEAAACFAFPSRTEGFGLPPVEAMLCGCPVVASPGGAIPEVCRDAVLYADVDDPAGWREQIRLLTTDNAVRADKIAKGRARAASFTWRRAGRQLYEHIARVAEP